MSVSSSRLALVFALGFGLALAGCGDDDDSGGGNAAGQSNTAGRDSTAGSSNTGGTSAAGDRCHQGCIDTLKAACKLSPKDQASCESDCHDLESGSCGTEYAAFQDCAEGKTISCDANLGYPVVAGCETQQNAFIACQSK
jgi:hypothetical protein